MTTGKRAPKRKPAKASRVSKTYWSQDVTQQSDALDLEADVFTLDDPKTIAASLKRSAEHSTRRKSEPYRSADVLHQPRRQESAREAPARSGARQDGAAQGIRARLEHFPIIRLCLIHPPLEGRVVAET
jgi:hypothetical protein